MKSIFSIFIESANSFTGQEPGEQVIFLLRRHWFVVVINLLFFAFFALGPVIIGSIFSNFIVNNQFVNLFFFLASLWYLLLWAGLFYSLTMYTLDVWIVTNKRIIDSTQHGFFNRTVSELHLNRIQDISVNVRGVIETFLHFGDLHIQTAGTEERFKALQIPNPGRVKDEIMKLVLKLTNGRTL